MTDNVVNINGKSHVQEQPAEPNPSIVDLCETMLANAKSGRMQGVVVVAQGPKGYEFMSFRGSWHNFWSAMGALEEVKGIILSLLREVRK